MCSYWAFWWWFWFFLCAGLGPTKRRQTGSLTSSGTQERKTLDTTWQEGSDPVTSTQGFGTARRETPAPTIHQEGLVDAGLWSRGRARPPLACVRGGQGLLVSATRGRQRPPRVGFP